MKSLGLCVGRYKNAGDAYIELEIERHQGETNTAGRPILRQTRDHRYVTDYTELHFCAVVMDQNNLRVRMAGQMQEDLTPEKFAALYVPEETLRRIVEIWRAYHGASAACVHQEAVPYSAESAAEQTAKCPQGYKYGSAWLVPDPPAEVVEEITRLMATVPNRPAPLPAEQVKMVNCVHVRAENGRDEWSVTLEYQGRKVMVPYFMGFGLEHREPAAREVLDSLCSDANAGEMAFEEFLNEFGYENAREARTIWTACKRTADKLRDFLGDDYRRLVFGE